MESVLNFQPDSKVGPVPGELLFRVTTGHVSYVLNAQRMRPYVHPLNVADFKGIRSG